ncbi:APC family permease [Paraburkholderia phytofirmans]|uniref:Amino acid permease n=1 Tax=Paraburkholderia phytofirmans OLGA172 TaxID=1417228 RepID=A0A160FKR9_9BURK|nr:APC family permease [Paraburkholderia phytofirmans]ANB73059.1 amino acid permease [Paraburkholderia phytofirmans OLGA172]
MSSVNDAGQELHLAAPVDATGLHRKIGWAGAFWVASGVPALVLFSVGSIAATVGKPSWIIWAISICFGFIQSFSYAEIAGLFPHKSGGASVYGAVAWVRYSKLLAPLSVWCNWFAWSPVLAIGSGLGAGYVLNMLFPATSAINTWQITLVDLGWLSSGLSLRVNATFVIGAAILLTTFAIQHRGILQAARLQMILGISALLPLLLVGVYPLLTGDLPMHNLFPLYPLAKDAGGRVIDGTWNLSSIELMAGGLFIAAWSTYGFETAVCYTREFKDPRRDTVKAIVYSGLLCLVFFTLVPLAFQGALGLGQLVSPEIKDAAGNVTQPAIYDGILSPGIYSGMGVSEAMAQIVHAGNLGAFILKPMLVFALVLAIMTSMAGSSRTLYQASVDGWLPKYLSHVNHNGAPTRAMWTDLAFNLVLLLMSDYVVVLAMSNVGYIIFNFLNLNAAWIHRLDRSSWERPFKAPKWVLGAGTVLSFANLALMGLGADVWGKGTLISGIVFSALIVPVFIWRHYVTDKGRFPDAMLDDMDLSNSSSERRAGFLPYAALVLGVVVVFVSHWITT